MLTVYGRRNSSNSAKVLWLLEELGQPYELVETGRGFKPTDTPEYKAMNPFGTVPTVRDGSVIGWESNAILRYLAERYGPTPLWGQDAAERMTVDRWMDWTSISLTPPLTRLRKARAAGTGGEAELPAVTRSMAVLERWLGDHAYVAGNTLSLADIVAAASVGRWLALPEAGKAFPNLVAYEERLAANEGYRRHVREALGQAGSLL